MAKEKEPTPFVAIPVEKVSYITPFTIPGCHPNETWMLADYDQQSITDDGALCPDKPILIVSNRGSQKRLSWGSLVNVVKDPPKMENEGTETERSQ